jgi:tetratricopeptide (TPR) repeat protein
VDNKKLSEKRITYKVESIKYASENKNITSEFVTKQIDLLDSLIRGDEYNMNYYLKRGLLNTFLNKTEEATNDFNKALSYDSRNAFILFNRANARIASLQRILYESSWDEKLSDRYNAKILRIYSDILYDLHKVLEIDPDFLYARYNIGYSRFMMEDYRGALTEFALVTKEKKIAEAHYNKALLQIFLEQKEEGCIELGIAGELGLKKAYSVIRKFCN